MRISSVRSSCGMATVSSRAAFIGAVTLFTAGALVGLPAAGNAAIFTAVQNSDHCTNPCNINPLNTVTITDVSSGVIDVKVSLTTGWSFITTGAGDASFAFSSSLNNLTLAIQPNTTFASGWSVTGPVALLKEDGLNFNTSAYGAITGQGPNDPKTNNLLDFHVSDGPTLTAASFVAALLPATQGANTTNSFFAADVIAGNGNTGIIDWGKPVAVPGPIVGAGLPGLIAALRWSSRAGATPS